MFFVYLKHNTFIYLLCQFDGLKDILTSYTTQITSVLFSCWLQLIHNVSVSIFTTPECIVLFFVFQEKEGPVTKSIRLTAALILRNLVIYSNTGKK